MIFTRSVATQSLLSSSVVGRLAGAAGACVAAGWLDGEPCAPHAASAVVASAVAAPRRTAERRMADMRISFGATVPQNSAAVTVSSRRPERAFPHAGLSPVRGNVPLARRPERRYIAV